MLACLKKSYEKPSSIFKSRDITLQKKVQYNQRYDFPSCHVWMWQLDRKEWWLMKNWWFWTVVLDKTLESPLDYKDIQQVNAKGNQSWIFIGRTNAEAEAPIVWLSDAKSWLIGKDPDAGKDWRQEERGRGGDGWIASLTQRLEFEQAPGVGEGQKSLACCSPRGHKELDMDMT